MLLMLDNYDSFTYNLVQYLSELGCEVVVHRNDQISLDDIAAMQPSHIVISPGPCTPAEAGISAECVRRFAGEVPILGICLGQQCMATAYGGKVVRADGVMHGKTSPISHGGTGLFWGCPPDFIATRYHSLVVDVESLPDELEVTAWADSAGGQQREIMALRSLEKKLTGVQFHPESIASEYGYQLLQNFLDGRY